MIICAANEVIFREEAVVSVYDDDRNWTKDSSVAFDKSVKVVNKQVNGLPKEKKSHFYKLNPQCDAGSKQEMEKFSHNSITDEGSLPASVHSVLTSVDGGPKRSQYHH